MADETKNDETNAAEPQEPPAGTGFGTLIIHDHLIDVIRAPWNLPKDDPNWKPKPAA